MSQKSETYRELSSRTSWDTTILGGVFFSLAKKGLCNCNGLKKKETVDKWYGFWILGLLALVVSAALQWTATNKLSVINLQQWFSLAHENVWWYSDIAYLKSQPESRPESGSCVSCKSNATSEPGSWPSLLSYVTSPCKNFFCSAKRIEATLYLLFLRNLVSNVSLVTTVGKRWETGNLSLCASIFKPCVSYCQ